MARSRRGNFAEARALIINENRHAPTFALQLAPLQLSHRRFQRLLAAPCVRQRLIALVADEHAAFAAAGRLRLGKERRNGVKFVRRDLRHGAQNFLSRRHLVHLLARKFLHARIFSFRFPACLPSLPHLPLGRRGCRFGDCPISWQLPIVNVYHLLSMVKGLLVKLVNGQLVNGLWSMVNWSMVYGL
jgi:hypothetical protein